MMRNNRNRRQKKKTFRLNNTRVRAGLAVLAVLTVMMAVRSCVSAGRRNLNVDASEPAIDVQLLDVNAYSRPGINTDTITGVVIHYTANPGSTAKENRDYFNSLQYTQETEASSNFVIGLDGEIIQCVPTWEVAYASNERNMDTVAIECCHPDDSGAFTDETYRSLVQLTAWLCEKFGLTQDDVIRHYDVTGKNCPRYFVEHEDKWIEFKENVGRAMERSAEEAE